MIHLLHIPHVNWEATRPSFDPIWILIPFSLLAIAAFIGLLTSYIQEYLKDSKSPRFVLREEYHEYVLECIDAQEVPWSFDEWFETCYWYVIGDNRTEANKDEYPYNLIAN